MLEKVRIMSDRHGLYGFGLHTCYNDNKQNEAQM